MFFNHQNYIKKVSGNKKERAILGENNMYISTRGLRRKKYVEKKYIFSPVKLCQKKVLGNKVRFMTNEIIRKKVHVSNMDFSTIEIRRKKYVETT